jgi:hypothetical protein
VVLRGTPYPTLRQGDGVVEGLLLSRLAPAALARLRAYEGASYALVPVRVATQRGPRRGRAWIAARWRAGAQGWAPNDRIWPGTGLRARM